MNILPGEKRPYLFAHRGCSRLAPENTLPAFETALRHGIPGIELDIHLCASGELVVTHDDNAERVTGRNLVVEQTDYSELKTLDAGGWKDEKFSGERMPLLQDVFDLMKDRVYYDIEIKTRKTEDTGIERKLSELLSRYSLRERCIVSSFNPIAIKRFKRIAPAVPTAIIYSNDSEVPWYLRKGEGRWIAGADILKPDHRRFSGISRFANRLSGNRPVISWTVDDGEAARRLLDVNIDGIISNVPEELLPLIG